MDFYIGLPASVDRDRVAHLHPFTKRDLLQGFTTVPRRLAAAFLSPFSLTAGASVLAAGVRDRVELNQDELRVLEMPGVNGTGSARAVAKLYGSAATGGPELGLSSAVREALEGPAVSPTRGLRDKVMHFRYVVLARIRQADGHIRVRLVRSRLWMAWRVGLRQALFRDVLGARPQR